MLWFTASMHEALQLRAQSLQPLHFERSISGRKSEKRDRKPSPVPTGQTVLHHVRPLRHASHATTTNVTTATASVERLFTHTSTE